MPPISIVAVAALLASSAFAQDAVQTDGDKYKVILENECVRVLDYRDLPGEKTRQHRHPAFVLYALSPFQRTLTLPDGKVLRRGFKEGDVMWSPAQTHIGENVGQTPTHVVIVELKQSASGNEACAQG
ncbi:MAG: cytoplasmic protein [Gemmatimonadaceae bacterium]